MDNKIVAVVNGHEITEKDIELTIARIPKDKQSYYNTEDARKQLIDQMISFELIYNYAKDADMESDEDYLKQVEIMKKEMLIQIAITKEFSNVSVTEQEVQDYYNAHSNMFAQEETVTARHILVDTVEKANEILAKIRDGMTFEVAAEKYSKCPSKSQGGNLGAFTKGQMVPEFSDAAFALELGVVSEPVKTQFGYHLIKVENRNPSSIRPFGEVKEPIKNNLIQERQNYRYGALIDDLKKKYKVELK